MIFGPDQNCSEQADIERVAITGSSSVPMQHTCTGTCISKTFFMSVVWRRVHKDILAKKLHLKDGENKVIASSYEEVMRHLLLNNCPMLYFNKEL